jgi:antigen flippase
LTKYIVNILSNLIKVSSGFLFFIILTKYNDPSELGQLGQLLTLSSAVMMFGTLGIQNKLIQDFAVDQKNVDINYLYSMLFISSVFGIILLFISYFFFADLATEYSAGSSSVFWVTIIFAYMLSLYVQFKYAMFNGFGDYKRLAVVNICGSIAAIFFAYIFLFILNAHSYQFVLIMCYPCIKSLFLYGGFNFKPKISLCSNIDFNGIKKQFNSMKSFVFMAAFSIILIYGYQYIIRIIIADYAGWSYVGQWQILQKHSEVISLIFTSIASLFIIPKIARDRTTRQLSISNFFGRNFLVIGIVGVFIAKYVGSFYVIMAFGDDYKFAGDILYVQILGDVFKVVAYCYTLQILCNSWVKLYVLFELFQYSLLLMSMFFFLELFGVDFIAISYVVSYLIFAIVIFTYFRFFLKR